MNGVRGVLLVTLGTVLQTSTVIMAAPPVLPFVPRAPSSSSSPSPSPSPPQQPPAPAIETRVAAKALRLSRPLNDGWKFRRVTGPAVPVEAWLPATVPGCVHTDLFANKKIGDPFYRLNEKDQQWIERESWEYRTTVKADADLLAHERIELVFAGLDTYAEVFVNGASVLGAANMFRTWRVEVKKYLYAGDNNLVVRFRSPILQVKAAYDRLGYKLPAVNDQAAEMVSMFTRKAPYHYGWDWGPRFVTSGIWRTVTLDAWDHARLDDVQIFQNQLDAATARLTVKARVQATRPGLATISVGSIGNVGNADNVGAAPLARVAANLKVGANDIVIPLQIEKPQRWWPNGLGPQHLYSFETTVSIDATVRDQRRTRIGLRTVEVVHERDKDGKSFIIRVNGTPVFMKGANWIPADS
ncbi:MAG: hypothetical protein H7X95_09840, partial [Deltaproteobacteria bacterium]|nr:hypothetical protein [Deltaproteobacteria bacterium]